MASFDDNEFEDGWDDDDDVLMDESVPAEHQGVGMNTHPRTPQVDARLKIYLELCRYLESLEELKVSLNALLEAEYNSPEKAAELVTYYQERPQLLQYTIEKELPRMDYLLFSKSHRAPLSDKRVIAQVLQKMAHTAHERDVESLLGRCANQSLLADILQVATNSDDGLIRPQYLASAVASSCRFVINPDHVTCNASFEVTLPTSQGRWKIADLQVLVMFVPDPQMPHVEYRLEHLQVAHQHETEQWAHQIELVSDFLASMQQQHPDEMDVFGHGPTTPQQLLQQRGLNFRDAFLQQSSTLAAGMQTAWNSLPGFLPDQVLKAAEQEHLAHSTQSGPAPPRPPPEQRPTSILGSLFGKIAKSVALPEEDPSLYREWQKPKQIVPPPPPHPHPQAKLQPTPSTTGSATSSSSAVPKLYRKEEETSSQPSSAGAGFLYRKEYDDSNNKEASRLQQLQKLKQEGPPKVVPPPKPAQAKLPPPLQPKDSSTKPTASSSSPIVEEGWDDDGLDDVTDFDLDGSIGGGDVDIKEAPLRAPTTTLESSEQERTSGKTTTSTSTKSAFDGRKSPFLRNDRESEGVEKTSVMQQQPNKPEDLPQLSPDAKIIEGWTYDPETDIFPTRKRWVNPCPGSRVLRSIS